MKGLSNVRVVDLRPAAGFRGVYFLPNENMPASSESHNPLCNTLKPSQRVWECVNLTRVNMNFPEVLVLILEYLSTRVKLDLQTCETFNKILKNNKQTNKKTKKSNGEVKLCNMLHCHL
jgi:hypothetical protein